MALFEALKATIAVTIADAIGKYHTGFFNKRVLKTMQEVEANTNVKNLPSAVVVSELNNNLMSRPEWIIDSTGQITGYKTPGGADTVFPFKKLKSIPISIPTEKWTKVTLPEKAAIVIVIYANTTSYQGAAVIDMVAKQTICNYMSVVSVGYLSETSVNCYFYHGTSGTLYYI